MLEQADYGRWGGAGVVTALRIVNVITWGVMLIYMLSGT